LRIIGRREHAKFVAGFTSFYLALPDVAQRQIPGGVNSIVFLVCRMAGFDAVTVEAIFTLFCYATAMFNSALSL
jgi:hypothetical protein